MSVNVNLIRVFDGPRHERLRLLWDCFAEYNREQFRLHWFPNPHGASHARCLNSIWEEEMKRPEPYAVITEHDFLPDFETFLPTSALTERHPLFAAEYCTRDPATKKLTAHGIPGAWYMLIDKTQIGPLNFDPTGEFNDPANGLAALVASEYPGREVFLLQNKDCYPRHYGTELVTGEHLFWSRHLQDPPSRRVAGFSVGDIQAKHDNAVKAWLKRAPSRFLQLVLDRSCSPLSV